MTNQVSKLTQLVAENSLWTLCDIYLDFRSGSTVVGRTEFNCATKVVYFATILRAQNLKVAALLDSDAEGDLAAKQDTLVNALGNKRILRTKDVYQGEVAKVEIEDILRETLLVIAKEQLGWDATEVAEKQPKRPIVEIFTAVVKNDFSKFKLAKAFIRWTREHSLADLTTNEITCAESLISKVNKALS